MNIIEILNLVHEYKEYDENETEVETVRAIDDVTLSIEEGSFVTIVGHNGSGKSTLAKHVNALLLPTGGTVLLCGQDTMKTEELWTLRKNAGMVFQNPDNQIVAAIVEEDVAFGPENIGVPTEELRKRVEDALRAVDMLDYREHAPHLLSGGQKQRVAIAGTLALGSNCIVLDEPTAMLDPKGRKEILNTMLKLNREQQITVVYITHFMSEAMQADRVVVMDEGRIKFQGTPKEVFSQVEELEKLGLEAPLAAKFAFELRKSGMKLPQGIITNEELAEALA